MLLAALAHQKLRGIGIYRTIFSSTVATSVAVASVIFVHAVEPADRVGAATSDGRAARACCRTPRWALPMVALVTVWQTLGLTFILMARRCRPSPTTCSKRHESTARARARTFRQVTLPMLSPTIFFAVVVGTIFAFQTFGQIDLLTQGGPLKKTNVLTYSIYTTSSSDGTTGKAAVLAIALFFITLVLALIQLRFLERRVHYER